VITTHWVRSIDELQAIGPRYDEMVLAAGDAGLFYQREWLARAWPYYQARVGGSLRFLIAEHQGTPVALAPLALRQEGWAHARRRVLGFIGGTWDELDNWMPAFLFATSRPDERADMMAALVDAIEKEPWDLLDLRFMRDSCPSHAVLRARFAALRATSDRLTTPRARLEGGWSRYWSSRSKRLLRMVERGRARAAEDGLNVVHEVTMNVPVERRGEVEAMHRARQQQVRATGRARSSPFEDPGAQRVFWSLIDWATSRGQLRAHWLRLGDRTAAYVIALHHAGTTFAYLNAIDPAAERYHPGSVVLAGLIEREALAHGAMVIDMMMGANLTKSLFATEELTNTTLSVVNPQRLRATASDLWIRAARALVQRRGR
jgi:CelD/BcsL family acetyltransferase involved in cellulose biosynthesis